MPEPISRNYVTCKYVLEIFIDIVTGEQRPTASEMEEVLEHLIACVSCQVMLGTYAVLQGQRDRSNRYAHEAIDAFRSSLAETLHATRFQNDMSAYIEVLEAQGEAEAHEQFPVVVAHLQWCKACRDTVQEARLLLHELESGLIEPPHVDRSC
jgi:predicted anti-sigma-YlaC factor YlaD